MSQPHADVAAWLAEAARTINSPRTVEETLDAIVHAAQSSLPGIEHVGISVLHPDGTLETKAATSQLVWELDALQYELNEGPCVTAMHQAPIVTAPQIRHDQRWPRFVGEAVKRSGLQAQMAVQLFADDRTIGGLNMYSTESPEIDPEAVHIAEMFATHAALALGRSRRESNLNEAIASRQQIGVAIGITMQRFGIDEERAFQYLVRASAASEMKVRDVAREVVDNATRAFRDGPE
jgi:GAF domain-containing protein